MSCTSPDHLQGRAFSYQPQWQSFPLLEVRADVLVTGLDVKLALLKMARLVVRDATDMLAKGHFVQALLLQVRTLQCLTTKTCSFIAD